MKTCGQGCSPACVTCIYYIRRKKWCSFLKEEKELSYVCEHFYCAIQYQREGWI